MHTGSTVILGVCLFGITAVVPIGAGLFRLLGGFLALVHVHITGANLQGLGADRQDKNKNQ